MKKIILSASSMIFAGALLVGGTGAFLHSQNSSTGNTFATGIIDLKIDNESYVTDNDGNLVYSPQTSWKLSNLAGKLFFNFLDLKPGDIGEDTISLHVKNNNAWACMNIVTTGTPENGQPEPEEIVDPTTGVNDGELQNNLYFAFWADDGDNVYEKNEKIWKQGLVKDIWNGENWTIADSKKNIWGGNGPIPANTVKYIGKAWCFGTLGENPVNQDNKGKTGNNGPLVRGTGFTCDGKDVGNIVQSDGIKADVSFSVVQSRSNSDFVCESDDTVPPPPSTSTLFSDNFNTCVKGKDFNKIDNKKWDQYGGVQGGDDESHRGKMAVLNADKNKSNPDRTEILTTESINTLGYKNITLKYEHNMDVPPGTTATLTVAYSTNGGSTWTTLDTYTTDHDWTWKTSSLSPAADNKSSIKVRFTLVGTSSNDAAYLDNITITGTSI